MTTPRHLMAGMLLGTMLAGTALPAERDPRGLAEAIAKRFAARREAPPQTHTTDFAGTDIGCIIMPRYELRPYGYPGHGFFCEVAATGEILGGVLNKKGRQLCDIYGAYIPDSLCYDFVICGVTETLCVQ
jgi:hypothetical protein